MLIKEYRIPLPMSVEEYRIAQLYMIQKKSRLDSTGEGSGVEIIENRPYKDGPGGAGQYTKKIYHIGNHIPGWLKAILPKSALQVIEEAWNAYPYTKMRTTCPFVEKFYVDVETKYLPDGGSTENVFNLPPQELSNQTTDLIDPIKDPIPSSQYSKEEDPLLYVSKKTNRGPLTLDWLQKPQKSIMCAYKRITVEFKYWGMQGKIEQFIHDGLRRPMLMGHRQAWVWQDEWCGLTISDIRALEKETQRMLAKKMGKVSDLNLSRRISDGDKGPANEISRTDTIRSLKDMNTLGSTIELLSQESVETEELSRVISGAREGRPTYPWKIGSVSSSDSDEEFFDAQAVFNSDQSEDEYNEMFLSGTKTFDQISHSGGSVESFDSYLEKNGQPLPKKAVGKTVSLDSNISTTSTGDQLQVLVLVVHGGNPLEMSNDIKSKENDFDRLVREFHNVMQNHYKVGLGRVVFRLVECPNVFKDALPALKEITPQLIDEYGTEYQGSSLPSFNFPVSSLPILAACSSSFDEMVDRTITKANNAYRDFLNSEAGAGFNGEVCVIGDCNGGLLAYEALCRQCFQYSFDTDSTHTASNPASPISTRMKSPLGLEDLRRMSDLPPAQTWRTPGKRLSSSDVDIHSTIDYVTGFNDLPGSREGSTDSVSTEEGLDRAPSHFLPFIKFENKLDFETARFFAFGSPIGLVSLYKKFSAFEVNKGPPVKPLCGQFYNLFHPSDPLSSRIEPLIVPTFSQIPAVSVPRYQRSPLGDGVNNSVTACINSRGDLFSEKTQCGMKKKVERTQSNMSTSSGFSGEMCDFCVSEETRQGVQKWWGNDRLDYALYNPKGLQQIPLPVLCPLLHISYWESKDVVAFLIRQILDISDVEADCSGYARRERRLSTFHSLSKLEKWQKKRTSYKIKNLAANHRANDAIAVEGSNQIVAARFTYGPLDVAALTGEKVDIYIMSYPPAGEWNLIDTVITGSGGRASFTVPEARRLDVGIYPVKMVVRGDHTTVDCNLAVLPPETEAVVFSIDGAFSASVSIRGRHAKVQPGAVDVVRHWQDQGYLIVYVTSRPDFQKDQVMLWMAEHNFPFGLVSFCGSLSTVDIQRHKTEYLRNLTKNMKVTIHAAYGSAKDVTVYCEVGVEASAIFVIGKNSGRRSQKHVRKQLTTATHLRDGYASHLTTLANNSISRPATGNSRITLRRGCFGLPRKHKHHSKNSSNN